MKSILSSSVIPEDCKYRDENGNIYGAVCIIDIDGIPTVYSVSLIGRFTMSMLKDIFMVYRKGSMDLVLDDNDVIKSIEPKLKRLGFILEKNGKITIAKYRRL